MPHARCSYCEGRRTLTKPLAEYQRLPACRTAGCEGRRKRRGKPRSYRIDRYRDSVECGGQVRPCYPGRGGCDGLPFPHRRGSLGCHHHPEFMTGEDPDTIGSLDPLPEREQPCFET